MKIKFLALLSFIAVAASCSKVSEEVAEIPQAPESTPQAAQTAELSTADIKLTEELAAQLQASIDNGGITTKSAAFNSVLAEYGVKKITRIFGEDERFIERERAAGLHLWYRVEIDPSTVPATKAADGLRNVPGVVIAEPAHKMKLMAVNDPYYNQYQWPLIGSNYKINVEPVWDEFTTGSSEVIVAVIDGGIDPSHEDLKENTIPGRNGGSRNFVEGTYTIKAHNHGTHVGGVIAATRNNGIGIAGIAGGDYREGKKGVSMLSCQVFTDNGSGGFEDAFRYAANNGAVIAQNSWGYDFDTDHDGQLSNAEYEYAKRAQISSAEKDAIDYFIKNAGTDGKGNQLPNSPMKGGVVFFSAGNDNIEYGIPASYEKVIAVASYAKDGSPSSFSNYGDWVDICAPGSSILSSVPGGYSYMSGTSMACPHASAVAALVLSARGGMGFTAEMLTDCILKGASDKIKGASTKSQKIGPMLDAYGSMVYGMEDAPNPVASPTVKSEVSSNNLTITWKVPSKGDDKPAYGAVIFVSKNRNDIANLNPAKPAAGVKTMVVETRNDKVGDEVSCTFSDLEFETVYYATVVSYNYGPVYAESWPDPIRFETPANNPPVIKCKTSLENLVIKNGQRVSLEFEISDPDGHDVTVKHNSGSAAEMWLSTTNVLQIDANKVDAGRYAFSIEAEDKYGAKTTLSAGYTIKENQAPVTVGAIGNYLIPASKKAGIEVDVTSAFADPDDDPLTYEVENNSASTVHATVSEGKLYLTPRGIGLATLNLIAKDPKGAAAQQTVRVLIREDGEGVSVYPTQVKTELFISSGENKSSVETQIINSAGAVVLQSTQNASAFEPAVINMYSVAKGYYTVKVKYDGKTYTKKVVKI